MSGHFMLLSLLLFASQYFSMAAVDDLEFEFDTKKPRHSIEEAKLVQLNTNLQSLISKVQNFTEQTAASIQTLDASQSDTKAYFKNLIELNNKNFEEKISALTGKLQKLEESQSVYSDRTMELFNQTTSSLVRIEQKLEESQKGNIASHVLIENNGRDMKQQITTISGKLQKLEQYQNQSNGNLVDINTQAINISDDLENVDKKLDDEHLRTDRTNSKDLGGKLGTVSSNVDKVDKKLDDIETQASRMEVSQNQNSGRIQEINTKSSNIYVKLEKLDNTMGSAKTEVLENGLGIKRLACQKLLQWADVMKSNFFSAAGRSFYFHNSNQVTWYKARDWCSERGMQLATLKTLTQLKDVTDELKNRTTSAHFWLSGNDIGRTAGQFYWSDGTAVDSALWFIGSNHKEPNQFGAGKETCVPFYTSVGKLYDDPCSVNLYTLCEIQSALSPCL